MKNNAAEDIIIKLKKRIKLEMPFSYYLQQII